jgi:hypothetical protein
MTTPSYKLPRHSGSQEILTFYQKQLDHLVMMAKMAGAKDHAWHRAKELDKQEYFHGIKDDLTKVMKNGKTQE